MTFEEYRGPCPPVRDGSHEDIRWMEDKLLWDGAVAAEREACAALAEQHAWSPRHVDLMSQTAKTIAAAIRARGAK